MEDIDKIIGELETTNTDIETIKNKTKDIITKQDYTNMETVATQIVEKMNANEKVAEQIYDLFYSDLANGRDRSQASKEALLRSLELRVENNKALAELAKALAKKQAAEQASKNNVGVFINTKKDTDFGIDIDNIKDEL